jgi:hypothetical protein
MAELYVIRANYRPCDDGAPRVCFFGYAPVLYRSEDKAQIRANELATSGDWGEVGPPLYYVEAVEPDDLFPAERNDYEDGKIGA